MDAAVGEKKCPPFVLFLFGGGGGVPLFVKCSTIFPTIAFIVMSINAETHFVGDTYSMMRDCKDTRNWALIFCAGGMSGLI